MGRAAAHHAYLALFTDALNDLFLVAAVVAFAGAVLSFALIRQRDFAAVAAGTQPAAAPATEEPEVEAA